MTMQVSVSQIPCMTASSPSVEYKVITENTIDQVRLRHSKVKYKYLIPRKCHNCFKVESDAALLPS